MTSPPGNHARIPAGAGFALLAALLFGAGTPAAKLLLGTVPPVMLAALFYLGSGFGLLLLRLARSRAVAAEAALSRGDLPWLAGAVFFGGMLGPVLMMIGLARTPASTASLLLNMESVFTVSLAWFVFRENVGRRIALGMLLILAGGIVVTVRGDGGAGMSPGALLIAAACLCWGIDNNLTQKVSARDPIQIAAVKGIAAGAVNAGIAFAGGASLPSVPVLAGALCVGLLVIGFSLVLFVSSLRRIGTARTSAYFSLAPFIGTLLSVPLPGERLRGTVLAGGALMLAGVWLHLTERHEHEHTHEPEAHAHRHVHDDHHAHAHEEDVAADVPHTHEHVHERLTHTHRHYPDIHHRHPH